MPSDVSQVVGHREREWERRVQWGVGANKSMRIKALLKYQSHIHTHTHTPSHTHTCKTIKCAYKIFNASKNAGKCQKMPENSKAIPSRFPLREKKYILCRFSIALNAPDHLAQRDFYCSCCFNIFICLLLFSFFFLLFASLIRNRIRVRQLPAQCSPLDWVNK